MSRRDERADSQSEDFLAGEIERAAKEELRTLPFGFSLVKEQKLSYLHLLHKSLIMTHKQMGFNLPHCLNDYGNNN